ncbi:MAG: T9SS type A sorting domain-containing protein [Flavobacteriales bacterium]
MKKIYSTIFLFTALLVCTLLSAQCENYSVQIFSDVAEGGPTAVDWVLTDINGDTLFEGSATFNAFTFFNSTTVCLEDGDYTLLFTGNVPLMGGAFLAGVQQGGENIFPTNEVVFGELTFLYEFNTQPLVIDCSASFTWEETTTPGLVQFQSTSTSEGNEITYGWEFAGDTQPGPEDPTYQYDNNGTYNVCLNIVASQDGQVGCIDTQCQDVVIAGFTNGEICPGNISIIFLEEEGCGNYHFAIQNAEVGASIAWFPLGGEGEFIIAEETDYYYAAPGIYELCVAYQSELCPSGTQICEEIAVIGCSDCPDTLQIISSICGEAALQFGDVNTPSTMVNYNWDDGVVTNGGVSQIHTYAPVNDVYNVCATYTNNYCAGGVTDCVELDYTGCFAEVCPTTIHVSNSGCFLYTLSVEGAIPGATYAWNVNGSIYSTPTVNYTIPFPNTVIAIVVYTAANCPDGITLNTVVTYNECGAVCPGIITAEEIDCNVYELSFLNVENDMQAEWNINGETYIGTAITYTLLQEGTTAVSAVVTNPTCPNPVSLSTSLNWDDCATACPQNIVATNLGCNIYELTTDTIEEGSTTEWFISGIEYIGDTIYYTLPANDEVQVEMNYTSGHCSFGVDLNTTISFEACAEGCPSEILMVELGCNTYQLSLNASEADSITWNINGVTYTGNNIGYVLNEEGTYNILVSYDGLDCSEGITLSSSLTFENCGVACPDAITIENLCNDYNFGIDVDYPELGATWTIDGEWITSTETSIAYTLPDDGDYEIVVAYNGPDCPLGTTLSTTVSYVSCNNVCPDALIIDSLGCNQYYVHLNNVDVDEQALWSINGVLLPPINGVSVSLTEPGSTLVEVFYEGTECTDGVGLSAGIEWNACGDGSCEASYTFTTGEDGEVIFTNTSVYEGTATWLWNPAEGNLSDEESLTFQYTENGIYNVCLTVMTETCTDTYCNEVSVENVFVCDENELEITIDGNNTNNNSELLYYSILDAANNTVANAVALFPVGLSANTQVFCLPDGCYSISADEPINLSGIDLIVMNITTSSLLVDITLPSSQLDSTIYLGVNADCPDAVAEVIYENTLKLFPNPAKDAVNIQVPHLNGLGLLQIADMTGRVVIQQSINSSLTSVVLNELCGGIYTVMVATNGETQFQKLEILK